MRPAFRPELPPRCRRGRLLLPSFAALLLALWTFLPAPALADDRAEARRHFRSGMRLIARGNHAAGIRELNEAYRIKPHPAVLFNVARAYQDTGQLEEALGYYRRYLATSPPDAVAITAAIAEVEGKLAAKLPPPAPEQPAPVEPGPGSTEATERLAAAADRLERALARAERLGSAPTVEAPAPAPAPSSREDLLLGGAVAEEVGTYEEVVVSASRRAQLSIEAPAATTVITADEIRASGATSIPDLLRRVPGADVMVMGASEADVSIRGFNQRISNKVLVLVDGRSVYQDFVGATFWSLINVPIEDIERIEVVRGPGSALYGANAALGVVNIITKPPGELRGSRVNARGGSGNTLEGSYAFGGVSDELAYRANVGYLRTDKYSRDFDRDRPDYVPHYGDPAADDLSARNRRFVADVRYGLGSRDAVTVGAGVLEGQAELYPIGALRNFYVDGNTSHVRGELALSPVKLKLFWNRTDMDSGPQYWPAGIRAIDAHVLQNVVDVELQGDFGFAAGGQHHLTTGAGWRLKQIAMDWFSSGEEQEVHLSGFLQDEWAPLEKLRVVGSARVDKHPLLQQPVPSPRGALIFLPTPEHAIRVSYGTAFRVPSFIEAYTALKPPVASVAGVATEFRGDEAIQPEFVTSAELGYRASLFERVDLDLAGYRETVEELIVQSGLTAPGFAKRRDPSTGALILGTSSFVNDPTRYVALGGEAGVRYTPIDRLDLRVAYAHEEITDDSGADASLQTPRDKVAVGATFRHGIGITINGDAAYASATEWVERVFDPAAPGGIRLDRYPLPSYVRADARVGYRFYKDRLELAAVGTNLLGTAYREHPFGNEIDTRVFGSFSASF